MKKLILIIFTMLCGIVLLHAQTVQSLVVQAKGGSETAYALSGVQRITFSGSNLLVTKKDNSQSTFTTAAVQKLLFAQRSDAYTINYNLNGGTNDVANTATYTYGEGLAISNPTQNGYTFGGWYDNAGFTGTAITVISTTATGDVTLYAKWTKIYTITATAGTGGSISPSGEVSVEEGNNQSFTITANTGYTISDMLVDESSAGIVSNYTFSSVAANHTIAASFELTTGIENTSAIIINMYPNPATDKIFFTGVTGKVYIYNITGQLVTVEQPADDGSVGISALTNGVYVVKVNGKIFKLIKE